MGLRSAKSEREFHRFDVRDRSAHSSLIASLWVGVPIHHSNCLTKHCLGVWTHTVFCTQLLNNVYSVISKHSDAPRASFTLFLLNFQIRFEIRSVHKTCWIVFQPRRPKSAIVWAN